MKSEKRKSNFWSDFFCYFGELMCVLAFIVLVTVIAGILLGGLVLATYWVIILPVAGKIAVLFGVIVISFVLLAASWAKADNS